MNKHPGLYSDIGKKARDLLYKGYGQQPPLHFNFDYLDLNCDLSLQIQDIVPGFGTEFRLVIPNSGQVELQYLRRYAGISGIFGLYLNPLRGVSPVLGLTGVIGHPMLSIGGSIAFDVSTRTSKVNAGLNFNSSFLVASLTMDKLKNLKASCYSTLIPLPNTAIATEFKHNLLIRESCFTIGTEHEILPFLLVKARANTRGRVGALVRQEYANRFFITVAGEIDFRAAKLAPKIGVSVALKS